MQLVNQSRFDQRRSILKDGRGRTETRRRYRHARAQQLFCYCFGERKHTPAIAIVTPHSRRADNSICPQPDKTEDGNYHTKKASNCAKIGGWVQYKLPYYIF